MSGDWRARFGQYAIALFLGGVTVPCWESIALAEIIPDETLGDESSVVTPDNIKGIESDRISGGAVRGSNLFHSFREFNIGEGKGGYFENPAVIENIFSRVTGGNPSNILGTLGVLGDANLFFLNPNGIIFGNNASLDLKGSFLATTADSIVFPDGKQFSGTNPEAPPLLTVNVQQPIGLEFQGKGTIARIENRSTAPAGEDLLGRTLSGLRVPDGKSLLLVGGDIAIDGGGLHAPGGRMELAGVAGDGTIGLNVDESDLNLSFPADLARADISLTNDAFVNASGDGGGEIQVQGRQITLTNGSRIKTGNEGSELGKGLTVKASESVELIGRSANRPSGLLVQVEDEATSAGGNLTVETPRLVVRDGGQILTLTEGEGRGGNVTVRASDSIELIGTGTRTNGNLSPSGIFAQTRGRGDAGDLTVETQGLVNRNGGQINTLTKGEGRGGNLTVRASESIELIGRAANGQFASNLSTSNQGEGTTGDAGNVTVETQRLVVRDGGQILTITQGEGRGGNLTLETQGLVNRNGGEIITLTTGEGRGGNLTVRASESIEVIGSGTKTNGDLNTSKLTAQTTGRGDAGNLTLETQSLVNRNGGEINTLTTGEGQGGNVIVRASESVELIGTATKTNGDLKSGGLFSQTKGSGNAGDLTVETKRLVNRNGGQINTLTTGEGRAGNLTVRASESVELIGRAANGQFPSNLSASTQEEGTTGDAGNVTVETQRLTIRDGAQIQAASLRSSQGRGGILTVRASESVELIGTGAAPQPENPNNRRSSGLFTLSEEGGDAGESLTVETKRLILQDGGQINASTSGSGKAGDVTVIASELVEVSGEAVNGQFPSRLTTLTTDTGNAGDLTVETKRLILQDGGQINASTSGSGKAGNVTVMASELVEVSGQAALLTDSSQLTVETSSAGKPGDITITTPNITIGKDAEISATATETSTNTEGGGSITINSSNLDLTGKLGIFAETKGEAPAGTLTIQSNNNQPELNIQFTDTAIISSSTTGSGAGGDINLNAPKTININGEGKVKVETTDSGDAGSINIETNDLNISNQTQISASTLGTGKAGNIKITADNLNLSQGARIFTNTTGSLPGGDINLTISDVLTLRNNSQITATAGTPQAGGDGGNIKIEASFIIAFPQENSDITANAFAGNGGNITINTNGIFGIEKRDKETDLSDITASSEFGSQGEVEINTSAIDPTRGLNNLPQEAVEAEVAQGCQTVGGKPTLEFFDIGRGGLPPTPEDLFSSEIVIAEWIPLDLAEEKIQAPTSETSFTGDEVNNMTLLTAFPCQSK